MLKVRLTGKRGGIALIDEEDFKEVEKHKWRLHKNGYVITSVWDKDTKTRRILRLHRFVMKAPEDKEVDHRDLNPLNCQKSNLRLCTHEENNRNKRIRINNKTGFKGVSIRKGRRTKPYMAHIRVRGKTIYLGYFKTKEEAGTAYEEASKKYHGEFGTNGIFPIPEPVVIRGRPKKFLRNDNTSGFTGINYHKRDRKWQVRLMVNGKRKNIGSFKTKEDAIKALREAKKSLELTNS